MKRLMKTLVMFGLAVSLFDMPIVFAHSSAPEQAETSETKPNPGFRFVTRNGRRVQEWTPGTPLSAEHPYIVAASDEQQWHPAAGYSWVVAGNGKPRTDLRVVWKAGLRMSAQHPHVRSGPDEGNFRPEPGYRWVNDTPGDFSVRWVSGTSHPDHPHVVSGAAVGKWNTAAGYRWLNQTPGDFLVVAVPSGPSDEQLQNAVLKILGAALANEMAGHEPQDIFEGLIVEAARAARKELINGAVGDLFPGVPSSDRNTIVNALCLALDHQLNYGNLRDQQARDALEAWLRRRDPDIANAAAVANLLYRVIEGA